MFSLNPARLLRILVIPDENNELALLEAKECGVICGRGQLREQLHKITPRDHEAVPTFSQARATQRLTSSFSVSQGHGEPRPLR